jgi:uncharacterized membrane protein YgcG
MKQLLIATIAVVVLTTACRNRQRSKPSWPESFGTSTRTLGRPQTVVFPFSVVAGGVETKEDVAEAMARDPKVARHYAELNVRALAPEHLKQDTPAYVSFRRNGEIYWTSRKVHLSKGERILSDGSNCVRGRCGNRISMTARTPVLPDASGEPAEGEFNTPEVRGKSIDDSGLAQVFQPFLASTTAPDGMVLISGLSPSQAGWPGSAGGGGGGIGAGGGGGGGGGGAVSGGSGGTVRSADAGIAGVESAFSPAVLTPSGIVPIPAVIGAAAIPASEVTPNATALLLAPQSSTAIAPSSPVVSAARYWPDVQAANWTGSAADSLSPLQSSLDTPRASSRGWDETGTPPQPQDVQPSGHDGLHPPGQHGGGHKEETPPECTPEPGTVALVGLGACALLAVRRRKAA